MIYFKAFDKNLNVRKGSIIGSMESNGEGTTIYINPIFVINPSMNLDIFVVKPVGRLGKSNGDSVVCKVIEVGNRISVEDILTLDIAIEYKINIAKRVFDKDIQKRYDLFNQIFDIDTTGEMLYKFAKSFPNAINHKLMYKIISDRDSDGTYLSKFTILTDGYNSVNTYEVALSNKNYKAIVEMAVNGIHSELALLHSELIKNCNDVIALKEFLIYVKSFKAIETKLLEDKIEYLNSIYEESAM